jgi:hypothetical protein
MPGQPVFAISGLRWPAGMNIALTYSLWLLVTVTALYARLRRFIWMPVPRLRAFAVGRYAIWHYAYMRYAAM